MASKQFNSVDGYSVGSVATIVVDANSNISGNAITATANVTSPRFISNVATGTAPFVVNSTTQVANLNVATAGTAGSATTAGTVTTAAQPNITSVGTLTSLNVSGNANAGNIGATNFVGSGASLTNLNASNLASGTVPSARLSGSYSISVTGSAGTAGTVTTAAQPNITSVGTLTGLTVSGAAGQVVTSTDAGGSISMGLTSGSSSSPYLDFNTSATPVDFNVRIQASGNTASIGSGTLSIQAANTNVSSALNVSGVITGNGSGLSAIAGANVTGTVSSATTATTAGTVTTAAQPNITSVGTLTSLTVSGNANAGNVGATNFVGSGASLTNLNASNLASGTVPSARLSGSYAISVTSATSATTATKTEATVAGTNSAELVRGNMADNDQFRILVGGTSTNQGYAEIATADDGTEPIYVRQYTGVFSSLARSATLLDATGNTSFPGVVSANGLSVRSNIAYVSPNGANTINSTMLNGGTLAWSGNAGQLFSITDSMTGNIFTVNDVSGIPLISVDSGGNIQFAVSGGFVNYGVTTGITAAGSTQATATSLTRPINVVSTVSSNTGVILPTVPAGARVIVMNTSGTALNVYPPSGAAINSAAANAAYSMPAGTRLEFISVSATQWYTMNATYG